LEDGVSMPAIGDDDAVHADVLGTRVQEEHSALICSIVSSLTGRVGAYIAPVNESVVARTAN
jgi:hypothetical protein